MYIQLNEAKHIYRIKEKRMNGKIYNVNHNLMSTIRESKSPS